MGTRTNINDFQLFWEKTGDPGEPLVLVHGSWDDHHVWDAIMPTLSQTFQVLTYDRRGHSQSERPPAQDSITDDVADLATLIETGGFAPAHISGQSFGGSIALRLAAERPDLFRSLHVHSPPLLSLLTDDPDGQQIYQGMHELLGEVENLLDAGDWEGGARQFVGGADTWAEMPPKVKDMMTANGPTFLKELRDPQAFAFDLDQLRSFSHPVLVTTSEHDMPFASLIAEKLVSVLPQAKRKHFAGADHDAHISHPAAYAQTIEDFFTNQ